MYPPFMIIELTSYVLLEYFVHELLLGNNTGWIRMNFFSANSLCGFQSPTCHTC